MTVERWGAFSVIDHNDASRLAADVLLYDRLVFPVPPVQEAQKDWKKKGWDPTSRAKQLEDLAIREKWTDAHHQEWQRIFNDISLDAAGEVEAEEVEAELRYEATRRTLIQGKWNYEKPPGVDKILVYSAFQSEDQTKIPNLSALDLDEPPPFVHETSTMQGLIAARILVPNEADGEESLKRAMELAHKPAFVEARRDFFDWQYEVFANQLSPELATYRLERAIKRYNSFVEASNRAHRIETIVTVTVVASTLVVSAATVASGVFTPLAFFGFAGDKIVTLGGAIIGAVAQLSKQVFGRKGEPLPQKDFEAGSMFHQIENKGIWRKRASRFHLWGG